MVSSVPHPDRVDPAPVDVRAFRLCIRVFFIDSVLDGSTLSTVQPYTPTLCLGPTVGSYLLYVLRWVGEPSRPRGEGVRREEKLRCVGSYAS